MTSSIQNLDLTPDASGTYLVQCKNKKKLLYDGLKETFGTYGNVSMISDKGNRNIDIRYFHKDSALNCYYDLCEHPDFMAELPHKFTPENKEDSYLDNVLDVESKISFPRRVSSENSISTEGSNHRIVHTTYYVRRKRKIIQARAFKRFMIALSACNQYKRIKDDYESLFSELKYQMSGVSLNFETGFADEVVDDSKDKEIPQLILAQDLYYFYNVRKENAVDVLITNLPPWYQEVDAYKLVLPLVPHDLLGIDWYRTYAAGSNECSFPYCIIYLKTNHAACSLRFSADGLVLDNHKISVCLMDDVEKMLLEFRRSVR